VPPRIAIMDLFLDFPLTTLFVLSVSLWGATVVARRWRTQRGSHRPASSDGASCPQCGAPLPPVAQFCRNCGRPVER
jgi:uncharacterized OB-fold protein